jgi:hypothetical protein
MQLSRWLVTQTIGRLPRALRRKGLRPRSRLLCDGDHFMATLPGQESATGDHPEAPPPYHAATLSDFSDRAANWKAAI